jgi:5S rRNA maturation endonuclease (ribonuclease M5)
MNLRKLDHVLAELSAYAGQKKTVGESTFVACPYHSERTPSFRIFHSAASKSPGFGKCYGCGASAKFDELAPKLGLRPYSYAKPTQQHARPVVKPLEEVTPDASYEFSSLPPNKIWREISTNLLIDIGCMKIRQYNTPFIWMPVNVKGEERGFIRARLRKAKDKPSYLNKPGAWAERHGLFPYDYAVKLMHDRQYKSIVVVEGPRDALRLLSYGIPAVALLGTQSWSKRKAHLLELSGAETVVLCLDGDCAGKAAEEKILPTLTNLLNVEVFSLRGKDSPYWQFRKEEEPSKCAKKKKVDLWDPGCMPLRKVKQLRRLVKTL